MQELIKLQEYCLSQLDNRVPCGNNCPLGHFCCIGKCTEEDCSRCLYQIQHGNPTFHYSCVNITYHYVLRFFNRFASEVAHFFSRYSFCHMTDINVISLGCGPGSEIYGLLKSFKDRYPSIKLHYEGHDLNPVWETVQTASKSCLHDTGHEINFYTTNLFDDFHGFQSPKVDVLILNYLLSDAALFMFKQQKEQFIDDIVDFILKHNVKRVFFNDINYYGNMSSLNSGTMLMRLMIQKLKQRGVQPKGCYLCFPGDPYRGNENWRFYSDNSILLAKHPQNTYMANVDFCNSKQIFVKIP